MIDICSYFLLQNLIQEHDSTGTTIIKLFLIRNYLLLSCRSIIHHLRVERREENESGLHLTGGVVVDPAHHHMTRRHGETGDGQDLEVTIGGGEGGGLGVVGGERREGTDHVTRDESKDQDQRVKEDQSLQFKNLQTTKRKRTR